VDSDGFDSNDYAMLGIGSRILPPDTELEELFEEETPPTPPPTDAPDPTTVATRIRELEARLDGMMRGLDGMMRAAIGAPPEPTVEPVQSNTAGEASPAELNDTTAVEAARELLESDYYRRTWGRAGLRAHAEEVDDFGLDPDFEQRLRPLLEFLFKRYFRVETRGIDNVPTHGRAVIVANHSGTLPLDGVMLREALRQHHPASRDLRWLAEDFTFYLPFIGVAMNRIGAVRACQENAQRLLATDHLIAVFPEGEKGIKKLFNQRYQLQRFGRGGFIRLCLRTKSPLIPCAIVGAEETNPMLYRLENASRLLGLDYLPITPTFPWLGPLGLVPAPTKWRIAFGEPIELEGYGPEAADDHVLIGRLSERVRTTISSMLDGSLRGRRSIWL
jgi:1-acyl-sn-glycerol-3-phosphate acyltransferase